jgi:molybdopterin-guanine dinucleotide biosynthesis protein A/molybdopterin-guanine dinucleotide biosynthesis protein
MPAERPSGVRTGPHATGVEVGVLIAGGDGGRAGVDKRFLVLEGRTLLLRNLAFLQARFPDVAVVIGRGQELDLGDGGGADVIEDAYPGSSPLVGIATALAHFRRPVFALAADIAFPDHDAADAVLAAFPGHDVSLPAMGRGYRQPLFAAYGPACLAPMVDLLRAGRHRIAGIFGGVAVAEVPFSDGSMFQNINTMGDYAAARRGSCAEQAAAQGRPAVVAVVGTSRTGVTALIDAIVPELVKLGARVGTVKYGAHGGDIECRITGSGRRGQGRVPAGDAATPEIVVCPERPDDGMPLADIARCFSGEVDIVVAESRGPAMPHRVELVRAGAGHGEPSHGSGAPLAVVTDVDLEHEHGFGLEDAAGLARFLAVRLDSLREY